MPVLDDGSRGNARPGRRFRRQWRPAKSPARGRPTPKMTSPAIRVAAVQMVSGASIDANLRAAETLIAQAAAAGAELVALPEY